MLQWTPELDAAIETLRDRGLSAGEIAVRVGPPLTRNAILGRAFRLARSTGKTGRRRGRPTKGPDQFLAEPRNARIMELRAQHLDYAAIGREVGVSRERVRQIINRIDKTWAGYIPVPTITKECPNCGKKWEAPSSDTAKFCSAPCWKAHAARTLTPREAESAAVILQARRDGKTWREAARDLFGATNANKAMSAIGYVRIYARKTGEDVSWAFRGMDAHARAAMSRAQKERWSAHSQPANEQHHQDGQSQPNGNTDQDGEHQATEHRSKREVE